MSVRPVAATLGVALVVTAALAAQSPPPTQNPPVPRPFPGAGAPPTAPGAKPAVPAQGSMAAAASNAALVPPLVYPAAQFLQEFDAGRGQRYFLYGTDQPYAAIVEYYKGVFRNGGREISKAPAMQQFDLGRFDENSMAYPPSVVVKDYLWNGSDGYPVADGLELRRYRTVIQIVPTPGS